VKDEPDQHAGEREVHAVNGLRFGVGALLAVLSPILVFLWIGQAKTRLAELEADPADKPAVALAAAADEGYCNAHLKTVLRRVLTSCGLAAGGEAARGCQPVEAKNVATMQGADFNSLFSPLGERAAIIQFDKNDTALDERDAALLGETFADQKGASYFFVVSRASPEGSVEINREISRARAEAVMQHLRDTFADPDLEKEVGLLWLGEEFAQLDQEFCTWRRSGDEATCEPDHLNRSAFVAWIDCRL
jgi:outer membrane protein OmpA-like peptidoglycan-associated protein